MLDLLYEYHDYLYKLRLMASLRVPKRSSCCRVEATTSQLI